MEEHYLNVNDKNFDSSDGFSILYRIAGFCLIFIYIFLPHIFISAIAKS